MKKRIISALLSFVLLFCCVGFSASAEERTGVIYNLLTDSTNMYVRSGPGTGYDKVTHNGSAITLHNGHEVTVLQTVDCDDSSAADHPTWHQIRFTYSGSTYTGYASAEFVRIKEQTGELTEDFETMIADFPEDYKVKLRELHLYYPEWKFEAVQIDMTWDYVISKEFVPQSNYVHSYDPYSWRSTASGSYDWTTDTWVTYSGPRYDASKETIEYFMDPRNFLDEVRIFQFESLSYDSSVHTLEGVEKMLKGTFMEGKTTTNLSGQSVSYAQAYMDAARYSGVSPYHLAARTRQEVGASGSNSTSGTVSGYAGIYNFYNIHATPTAIEGLDWASQSGDYGRPWNTQYKSIYNGGKWIGTGYIDIGQDTLYFQKFAVVGNKLFWHQYMQTISAPYSEASTIYNSYSGMDMLNSALTFRIPVYKDMPETACVKPTKTGSPNNWLKTLSVEGQSLTPSFECDGTTDYSLIVENHISSVKIDCSAVSSSAIIEGGSSRTAELEVGTNAVNIKVTAANGDVKTYVLTIVRKSADGSTDTPDPPDGEDPPVIESGYNISYTVTGSTVTGVGPNTTLKAAKAKLGLYGEATADFYNASGTQITDGEITTGTTVKITANGKTDTFTFVIYGDTNGDGAIDAIDLLMIRRYMLSTYELKGTYLTAGDCNKDGKVDAIDLLMVRRNLLGTYTIEQ